MLKLISLQKKYGSFNAVNAINLTVTKGSLFGFLGPNGAGKTTTIKMIVGLLSPTSGTILMDDVDVWKEQIKSKSNIGYIPDQPFLYDRLTGKEFLYFCGGLYNLPNQILRERIDSLVDQLRIGSWLNKRCEEYSQGMRQRIVIASAFIHNPGLIIVDEPMVGLDPQSAYDVKKLFLNSINSGTTIFMSTHSLNIVEEICTHVGIINKGNIIFNNSIDILRKMKEEHNHNLEDLFIQLTNEE